MFVTPLINNNTLLELCLILKEYSEDKQYGNFHIVGGAVRNMLLNQAPKDFDIVIDIKKINFLFQQQLLDNNWKLSYIDVQDESKNLKVIVASKNNQLFEIVSFRGSDETIISDAQNRDCTINSLYYQPFKDEIIDPSNLGLKDIKNKIIRFNTPSKQIIEQDPCRIFRVYRQYSQLKYLGFIIHPKTLKECRKYFELACEKVNSNRIMNEIEKMVDII